MTKTVNVNKKNEVAKQEQPKTYDGLDQRI